MVVVEWVAENKVAKVVVVPVDWVVAAAGFEAVFEVAVKAAVKAAAVKVTVVLEAAMGEGREEEGTAGAGLWVATLATEVREAAAAAGKAQERMQTNGQHLFCQLCWNSALQID